MHGSERRLVPFFVFASFASLLPAPGAFATDGVLEINQTVALAGNATPGDTPGFPVEIFTPGSFRLTSDLVVPGDVEAAINVYAGGTRIDLNGFSITSGTQCSDQPPVCAPVGTGVGINASGATDVRIRNGRIAGFGVNGVSLFDEGAISEVTIENNGQGGITADEGCLITDNIVRRNGGIGIQAGAASRIVANVVTRNAGLGISAPITSVVKDNAVSLNVGSGTAGARGRRFYVSTSLVLGNAALTACSPGFHLASLWEIFDPSALSYDQSLGLVQPRAGAGPPSGPRAPGSYGWIRGSVDCNNWSSTAASGFAAVYDSDWLSPTATWPWYIAYLPCSTPSPVWCVED